MRWPGPRGGHGQSPREGRCGIYTGWSSRIRLPDQSNRVSGLRSSPSKRMAAPLPPLVVPVPRPGLLADAEPKDRDGSGPCAVERFQVYPGQAGGREEGNAVAEQDRQDIHQDLVHESPPQALTGHVGAEDFEVLAARGAQCRGDGFPDITGEERDRRVRRVRRVVGEDELSSPS